MKSDQQPQLAFYTEPGKMTNAGRYAPLLKDLAQGFASLATVAQGLLIHEHLARRYGVKLSDGDRASVHIRPVEQILEQIVARDSSPLDVPRTPAGRLPGNCRHFTVMVTAMLRSQGTAARARCGFGNYFGTGANEDHWVCEYWNTEQHRWILADAQIDDMQQGWFPLDFDVTDVPRDRFLVAGDAWEQYRSGTADPAKFGLSLINESGELSLINESGDWWIACNLMRDAAALLNVELLPWDTWGAMPAPDEPIGEDLAALFDRLAALTREPDGSREELSLLCQDERLRVPPRVRNDLRKCEEAI